MGLDNLDQNYYDPNGEGDNHPWGHKSNYKNWEYYKKIKDRLNMNKSLLADEIQPKLTKTFNQEEIKKLRKIIEEDDKRLQDKLNK